MSVASKRPAAAPEPTAPATAPRPSFARSLLRTARPKQWVKNVLVFAAPAAAGVLSEPAQFARTMVAFVAFCLAASGTYFLNDAMDVEADRLHPTKRNRPVAAGYITTTQAKVVAVVLIVAALAISAPFNTGRLVGVVGAYVVVTVSYSLWLKHEPILDLGAVAAGFGLRAIAGGYATGVELSNFFLIVVGAGSLFIVAGKRHAELATLGDSSTSHRATLGEYSDSFLNYVRAVTSGVAITGYALWAFERADQVGNQFWFRLSIVPFVLGILRYALTVEQGGGGAPEEVVLGDRMLQVFGVLLFACFAIGVYAG
ncbi:MAG TPA: decaprenyl-phosphate phosphoribosyltransferase [Acidimicrobiales bacterium]